MRKVEFTFRSSDQQVQIHAVKWEPEGKPRAILQIAHGMAEYIERYDSFAKLMAACGILVVGNDHLGHGDSLTSSQELGYFTEKDGDLCVMRDIHRLYELTTAAYPRAPYFMLGHSMGSFFVRRYLCEYKTGLDGVILSGTGKYSRMLSKAGMLLAQIIRVFHGWHYKSEFMDNLIVGKMNDSFQPVRTQKDWLTRDESVVDAYIKDSKCGFKFSLNACYSFFKLLDKIEDKELVREMNKDTPILFISGENDPVGDFGNSVKQVAADFREAGMKQVDCILYPEYRHEILNELGKEKVYKDIARWIADKLDDRMTLE